MFAYLHAYLYLVVLFGNQNFETSISTSGGDGVVARVGRPATTTKSVTTPGVATVRYRLFDITYNLWLLL